MGTRLDEIEDVFFLGVVRGWAGGSEGQVLSELKRPGEYPPGPPEIEQWRAAIWIDSLGYQGYRLTDCWGVDPGSCMPSGFISITHWGVPVWQMWCGGGGYPKEALPFLREALMMAYDAHEFRGGRGPAMYRQGDLIYTNDCTGDFTQFSGTERVARLVDEKPQLVGMHKYWGGSFVFLK